MDRRNDDIDAEFGASPLGSGGGRGSAAAAGGTAAAAAADGAAHQEGVFDVYKDLFGAGGEGETLLKTQLAQVVCPATAAAAAAARAVCCGAIDPRPPRHLQARSEDERQRSQIQELETSNAALAEEVGGPGCTSSPAWCFCSGAAMALNTPCKVGAGLSAPGGEGNPRQKHFKLVQHCQDGDPAKGCGDQGPQSAARCAAAAAAANRPAPSAAGRAERRRQAAQPGGRRRAAQPQRER